MTSAQALQSNRHANNNFSTLSALKGTTCTSCRKGMEAHFAWYKDNNTRSSEEEQEGLHVNFACAIQDKAHSAIEAAMEMAKLEKGSLDARAVENSRARRKRAAITDSIM